jgi:hypothetical protein
MTVLADAESGLWLAGEGLVRFPTKDAGVYQMVEKIELGLNPLPDLLIELAATP